MEELFMSNNNNRIFYIYLITNNINGKTYVGQRKCPIDKTLETDNYMGSGLYLHEAYNKYGVENFSKEILAVCYSRQIVNILEIKYIELYRSVGKAEYNIARGGNSGDFCYFSEKSKQKKIESMKRYYENKVWTEEEKDRFRYWKGKKHTPEQIKKNSESHKGLNRYPKTEEHRRKISETLKGNIPGNKGMKMDKAFCDKQKQIKKDLYSSEKGKHTKQLLREANVGLYFWHNGEIEIHSKEAPDGFSRGRLNAEHKVKYWYTNGKSDVLVSICPKGYHYGRTFPNIKPQWYNNGIINVYAVNCPSLEFVKGQFHK